MSEKGKMKDKSTEWLADLPDEWQTIRAKYVLDVGNGCDPTTEEGDIPVYGSGGESFRTCKEYKEGPAVLLGRKGTIDRPNYIEGRYWNVDTAFDVRNPWAINLKFYYYVSTCFPFGYYTTKTTIPSMTQGDYLNMSLPFPSNAEQDAIVKHLDKFCDKVDRAIALKNKQLEQLATYKKSLISECVCRGVPDSTSQDVVLKDSGIEWIGEIPEHWKIIRAKYVLNIGNGCNPMTEDGNTPVYGSGGESFKACVEYKEGPAVLLGRKGTIDRPNYIEGHYWNVDTAFDVRKPWGINLKFYFYIANCFPFGYYTTKTTIPSMTQNDYLNMVIPYPSLAEQNSIVTYLDQQCKTIDNIKDNIASEIAFLEQYKKSTIWEYVTGKRRVPSS